MGISEGERERGLERGGGGGAKSYDHKKAWSAINHSILSSRNGWNWDKSLCFFSVLKRGTFHDSGLWPFDHAAQCACVLFLTLGGGGGGGFGVGVGVGGWGGWGVKGVANISDCTPNVRNIFNSQLQRIFYRAYLHNQPLDLVKEKGSRLSSNK
jgi:hypothetical protein